jgi:hypothetical protein
VIRGLLAAAAALLATSAGAFDRFGVVAVADPPAGPDADLAELAHQLRAACRDRIGGVEDVPTMRARLLGQTSNATLSELDRAYGGALAVYQNGEFESALRTLHAIIEDLESLPESGDAYAQWVRAQLRLAHAALTIAREEEAEGAFFALARTDLAIAADPDQFSPNYRRRYDAVKAKVRALAARRLTVTAEGREGTVFVNGRPVGSTPLSLWLPAGTYRIGGSSDDLRVPSFRVDLRKEDRSLVLDFALSESLRVNAGPGLALPAPRRGDGIVRAGAWLGVDRVVAVSRVFEGEAAFLLGSIYDVRRGALLREGSVRMVAGSVPAANLGALAAFLLTGQSSRDVKDLTREKTPVAMPSAAEEPLLASPPSAALPRLPLLEDPLAQVASVEPPRSPAPAIAAKPVALPSEAAPRATRAPAVSALTPTPAATRDEGAAGPRAGALQVAAVSAPTAAQEEPASSSPPARADPPSETPSLTAAAIARALTFEAPPAAVSDRGGRRHWMRRSAVGSGVVAGGLLALALQQGLTARSAYGDADAMVTGGVFVAGSSAGDVARYHALQDDGDAAKRNAWVSAGAALAFAAAAGFLGWWPVDALPPAGPQPAVAFRF